MSRGVSSWATVTILVHIAAATAARLFFLPMERVPPSLVFRAANLFPQETPLVLLAGGHINQRKTQMRAHRRPNKALKPTRVFWFAPPLVKRSP